MYTVFTDFGMKILQLSNESKWHTGNSLLRKFAVGVYSHIPSNSWIVFILCLQHLPTRISGISEKENMTAVLSFPKEHQMYMYILNYGIAWNIVWKWSYIGTFTKGWTNKVLTCKTFFLWNIFVELRPWRSILLTIELQGGHYYQYHIMHSQTIGPVATPLSHHLCLYLRCCPSCQIWNLVKCDVLASRDYQNDTLTYHGYISANMIAAWRYLIKYQTN